MKEIELQKLEIELFNKKIKDTETQAVAKEEQGENYRVRDVIGKSHAPHRHQTAHQSLYYARFVDKNQRRGMSHYQQNSLKRINQIDPIDGYLLHSGEIGFERWKVFKIIVIGENNQRQTNTITNFDELPIVLVLPVTCSEATFEQV